VVDDPDAPSRKPIVPGTVDSRTAWLSADIEAAIPIAEWR